MFDIKPGFINRSQWKNAEEHVGHPAEIKIETLYDKRIILANQIAFVSRRGAKLSIRVYLNFMDNGKKRHFLYYSGRLCSDDVCIGCKEIDLENNYRPRYFICEADKEVCLSGMERSAGRMLEESLQASSGSDLLLRTYA